MEVTNNFKNHSRADGIFGLGTAVGTEFILTLTFMFEFLLEEWQCFMTCILEIRFHVVQTGPELKLTT